MRKLTFLLVVGLIFTNCKTRILDLKNDYPPYPAVWFAPIQDPNKPDWEILPQERHAGEVILSKRNELGILSNFAATPFGR